MKKKSSTKLVNTNIANSIAKKIYMIQPTNFISNVETKADNHFMQDVKDVDTQDAGLKEFTSYVQGLKDAKVDVEFFTQKNEKAPDSVFLNNWFSTHKNENFPDGLLILYPLKSPSRRIEKDTEVIERLKKVYKDFVDLSYLESENEFLESTGSLLIDHNNLKVYVCLSERATEKAVHVFLETLNKHSVKPYQAVTFKGTDKDGKPIYHTNVMMAILENHVVICLDAIKDNDEKEKVKAQIQENRKLLSISFKEMEGFCGNIINVKNKDDDTVVIMSKCAQQSFSKKNAETLKKNYKIVAVAIPTIEKVGGGSARCMVAEIF